MGNNKSYNGKKQKNNKELDKLKSKYQEKNKKEDKQQLKNISVNTEKKINNQNKKNSNNIKKTKQKNNIENHKSTHEKKVNKQIIEYEVVKTKVEIEEKRKKDGKEQLKNINNKEKKKKLKTQKKIILILLLLLLISSVCLLGNYFKEEKQEKIKLENIRKEKELVEKITSYYNDFVKTKDEVEIYNKKEEVIGKLYNAEISLEETEITKDTKYFKIKEFEDAYIRYEDTEKIESLSEVDDRYKNYIVYNQNIVTNEKIVFYDELDNPVYEFSKSFNLPIIIKETSKYGVEFNNRLLYIKHEDIKEIKDNYNTDLKNANGVAVLNYHSFYDETNYKERLECPTSICHSKAQFKTHLEYLKENNIFTLTAKEIEMYVDGKLQLPKSVYITIDDGVKAKHAVDMLTEYKMNATIFLVTSWAYEPNYYITEYIELHSHTHNLHNPGVCPGGQGGAIKCLDRETLLADLRQSREDLNGSTVFCYPFYEYNNYSINVLKEAGFTMAFGGEYGDMLVKVGMDKFRLPRFVITTGTTMYSLDRYFDKIKN